MYLGQTKRISLAGAIMAIGVASATYAAAQDSAAGRYTMHQTEDGFVRLDTQTGAVSLCRKEANAWSCRDIHPVGAASPSMDGAIAEYCL